MGPTSRLEHEDCGYPGGLAGPAAADDGPMGEPDAATLALVARHTTTATLLLDASGRVRWANPAFTRQTGYCLEESLGRTLLELMDRPPFAPELLASLEVDRCAGRPSRAEGPLWTKQGELLWVDVETVVARDVEGRVAHSVVIQRDVTARRLAEQASHTRSWQLASAARVARLGTWEWDVRADLLSWSPELHAIAGTDPGRDRPTRELCERLAGAEAAAALFSALDGSLTSAATVHHTMRIQRPDGGESWVKIDASIERDAGGDPVRMVGVAQDVTELEVSFRERRRLEAELAKAQRMEALGRLAGGVAHDFNNLLAVILGGGRALRGQLEAAGLGEARGLLDEVLGAAERAAEVTSQLLVFGQRRPVTPAVVELGALVRGLERLLGRLLGEQFHLEILPCPSPLPVMASRTMLEQVVVNLAVNARDAMAEGGPIVLSLDRLELDRASAPAGGPAGAYASLAVIDRGVGMSEDVKRRLFEPFFTTKEPGRGTGLGLSTVFGVVHQAGGDVAVESTAGRGSRFTVRLPLVPDAAGRGAEARRPSSDGGAETVMVVDDEPAVRALLKRSLASLGYTVLAAASGAEALALAATQGERLDLLVTDVRMPSMDGWQVAEALRRGRPRLPVLLVSAFANDLRFEPDATTRVLAKPFAIPELATAVRGLLGERASAARLPAGERSKKVVGG